MNFKNEIYKCFVFQIYAITSFIFVLASIMGFTLETIPAMHYDVNITRQCTGKPEETVTMTKTVMVLEYLDYVCTAFFTLELIIRLVFAPNKLNFIRDLMNIIDILALLPLYVQIIMEQTDKFNCHINNRAVLETIFILRIIRIFRIFHLVKHYRALKILIHAIRASIQELLMLSIFLVIAMLVFSTLIFYAERNPNSEKALGFYEGDFGTIPIGFWWATITMTTVGYGDIYPETPMGMAIGSVCAVWGVLLLALTIPVISNNFALFYTHARTRERISNKDRARKQSEDETVNAQVMHSRTPSGVHQEKNKLFKGVDAKAFLLNTDTNSTTEETGLMMAARNMDCDSVSSTPQKNTPNNIGNNKAESVM